MFIYNITIKVDNNIAEEWLQWQKEIYIPAMLDTGFFMSIVFINCLNRMKTEGKTFVINFLPTIK